MTDGRRRVDGVRNVFRDFTESRWREESDAKSNLQHYTIRELQSSFVDIEFPEYQREPRYLVT